MPDALSKYSPEYAKVWDENMVNLARLARLSHLFHTLRWNNPQKHNAVP